jgi:HrpA-like RNA helicase
MLSVPLRRQAAAQRSACAGRLRAGHSFRLCTEEDFLQLPQQTVGMSSSTAQLQC